MRTGYARVRLELSLSPEVETFMRATRVKPVAQIWAQICVIVLRLPRASVHLSGDRGPVNPKLASNLRLAHPTIAEPGNLDTVVQHQMSVSGGLRSATPLGLI
jgi:hypothetical protein